MEMCARTVIKIFLYLALSIDTRQYWVGKLCFSSTALYALTNKVNTVHCKLLLSCFDCLRVQFACLLTPRPFPEPSTGGVQFPGRSTQETSPFGYGMAVIGSTTAAKLVLELLGFLYFLNPKFSQARNLVPWKDSPTPSVPCPARSPRTVSIRLFPARVRTARDARHRQHHCGAQHVRGNHRRHGWARPHRIPQCEATDPALRSRGRRNDTQSRWHHQGVFLEDLREGPQNFDNLVNNRICSTESTNCIYLFGINDVNMASGLHWLPWEAALMSSGNAAGGCR